MNAPRTPLETAATHGIGTVDQVMSTRISGWAWDPLQPDEPVMVDILDGDEVLATVLADLPRPDLASLGMGNGRHGFALEFGLGVLPFSHHMIHVRRHGDGVELHQSPWCLDNPVGLDDAGQRRLRRWIDAECAGARRPGDLDRSVSFVSQLLGQLMSRQAELMHASDDASGLDLGRLAQAAAPSHWPAARDGTLHERYPAPDLAIETRPRVSVIIPVFNQFALTHACLCSLAKQQPQTPFEVIVVDDASSDETILAPLLLEGRVRVLRNETNMGFIRSCNRGAKAAAGELLFFLNNDTLVQTGWLDELVATFEAYPEVGVAGSKLLNPDGTLQECGGVVWRLGDAWNWGRGQDPAAPQFCHLRDVDYVSGAALMVDAQLFGRLNGFDERYLPAYYEDTDLCFRVRDAGRRVVVQPLSCITHLEGQSNGTSTTGFGVKRHQATNRRKFLQRWAGVLAGHRHNGVAPALEANRYSRRFAVFIDDSLPTPDQDAGSQVAEAHIHALIRLGYQVTFVPAHNMRNDGEYARRLQRLGVECIYKPFFGSVEEYLRDRPAPVDLVYVHRVGNASRYLGLIRRQLPAARVLFNVADLHHLRLEREAELTGDAGVAREAGRLRDEELSAVRAADVTLVHSSAEQLLLAQAAPAQRVVVVPWSYSPQALSSPVPKQGVVFVGGYRHSPNVDAAKWLVRSVMPLVWDRLPDVSCTLVGSHMPDEIRRLAGPRVETLGHVEDLLPIYARRVAAVAPLRYGAGIKGKVLEAMSVGVPCVMTPVAAEGLPLDRALAGLVGTDPQDLAQLIVGLHEDPLWHAEIVDLSRRFIEQHFSDRALDQALSHALKVAAEIPEQPQLPR